jgi:ribosome-associated protein
MTASKKKPSPKRAAKAKPAAKARVSGKAKRAAKAKAASKAKPAPRAKVRAAKPGVPAPAAPAAVAKVPAALVAALRALDDKKAEDLRVLRLGSLSSIADYYVLATGTSDPHLRALRVELDRVLSDTGSPVRGIEAQRESGWVVVDAFDMIFHLFRPETRAAFRLEALWKDAEVIPAKAILAG